MRRAYVPTCHWGMAVERNLTSAQLGALPGFPDLCLVQTPIGLSRRSVFCAFVSDQDDTTPAGSWALRVDLVATINRETVYSAPISTRKFPGVLYDPWFRGGFNAEASPAENTYWGGVFTTTGARMLSERVLNIHADSFFIRVSEAPAVLQNYWLFLGVLSQFEP